MKPVQRRYHVGEDMISKIRKTSLNEHPKKYCNIYPYNTFGKSAITWKMSLFRHNLGRYILTNPGNIGNNKNPTTLGNVEIS